MATKKTYGKMVDLPQYYTDNATEGAANGGTMNQIPSSLTTRDKTGILIHSYEIWGDAEMFAADADGVAYGITQLYNAGTVPGFGAPGVIDHQRKITKAYSSVGVRIVEMPFKTVFDQPRLAHPAALYWYFTGVAQGAALTLYFRMEYSYVDLTDLQYQDIIQTIVLQNAL
jgi:hypothetical protein